MVGRWVVGRWVGEGVWVGDGIAGVGRVAGDEGAETAIAEELGRGDGRRVVPPARIGRVAAPTGTHPQSGFAGALQVATDARAAADRRVQMVVSTSSGAPTAGMTTRRATHGRSNRVRRRPSPLLSIAELAELLGMHRSTLYRAVEKGLLPLPIVRIGARMSVPRAAVERLLTGAPADDQDRTPRAPDESFGHPTTEESEDHCPGCGSKLSASTRPTCSAARRSSSPTASV